jgi:hypothetical protein
VRAFDRSSSFRPPTDRNADYAFSPRFVILNAVKDLRFVPGILESAMLPDWPPTTSYDGKLIQKAERASHDQP